MAVAYSKDGKQRTWAPGRLNCTMPVLTRETSEPSLSQERFCTSYSEFGSSKVSRTIIQEWIDTGADFMEYICVLNIRAGSGGKIWAINIIFLSNHPIRYGKLANACFNFSPLGRFWNEVFNALSPTDNGEKFGSFHKNKLQATYSRSLLKHIAGYLSFVEYQRFTRDSLDGPYYPKTSLKFPEGLTQAEGQFCEGLVQVLKKRRARTSRDDIDRTPHIVTITDLSKEFDEIMD
ncbi:inosine/uridine-preferring nucleoside hydrolase [Diplocarpon rosae]|nr:inosine/uridine-preferring nucleoside hydrolase [Diplocarpon rosae]